jgi:hypothetical protein
MDVFLGLVNLKKQTALPVFHPSFIGVGERVKVIPIWKKLW